MDFDKVLKERKSVRRFSSKKVPFSDVVDICEAARYAPMAGNIYTVRLIVVSEEKTKQELVEAAIGQNFISDASYIIVVCSDMKQIKRSYGSRAEMYAKQQAGAAIENMLLKTVDLKLASCWIGAFDENAVKRILKIPDEIEVEALLPVAKEFGENRKSKKPNLDLITYFEKWKQRTQKPIKKPNA